MPSSPTFPRLHLALAALGILSLLAFNGCGDDDEDNPTNPNPTPTTTGFLGSYVNGNESGLMTITVNTTSLAGKLTANASRAAAVTATGVITPDGGSATNLTGTYDSVTDSLYLAGAGYAFGGEYDNSGPISGIAGLYLGPNGAGQFGCIQGTASSVQVYCGTYQNADVSDTGNWNILITGSSVLGIAVADGQVEGTPLEGTVTGTGTTRAISLAHDNGSGGVLSAAGTLNTTTNVVGGTWHTTQDAAPVDSGTWSGDLCTTP